MKTNIGIFLFTVILFSSCSKKKETTIKEIHFGVSEYYKPFLWVKSDTAILEKTLKYNFNDYATENNAYATISIVNSKNELIDEDNILLFINGKPTQNNTFTISSNDPQKGSIKVGLKVSPNYNYGYNTGYISVGRNNLDRINNNDLNVENRLFKWELEHEHVKNPLLLTLLILTGIVIFFLLLWFLWLRNSIYPKFSKGQVQILEPYFSGIRLNENIREVIFTDTMKKQSTINKIFTGNIHYDVNNIYSKSIHLFPKKHNKIKIKLPLGASIKPTIYNLEKYNKYEIKLNNNSIKIQYS